MLTKQYSVVLVNLDPTIGSEKKKTRPCVIVSPDEMNRYLKTIVLAPMTTRLKEYPTRVPVIINGEESMIAIDQIRTIDKSRIIKTLGTLAPSEIENCKQIIRETFVD